MREVRLWLDTVLLNQHHSLDSVRGEEVCRRKSRSERDRTIVKLARFHLPTIPTPVGVEQESGGRIAWQIQLNKLFRTLPQGANDWPDIHGCDRLACEWIKERFKRERHCIVERDGTISSPRERDCGQKSFGAWQVEHKCNFLVWRWRPTHVACRLRDWNLR